MAGGGARLTANGGARFIAVVAAVLVLHVAALDWLSRELEATPLLRPLPTPMFTRLLKPEAPATPAAQPKAKALRAARPRQPAITSLADAQAKPPKRAASKPAPPTEQVAQAPASTPEPALAPEPPAPEPPAPEPPAEAPNTPASAPVEAASAPVASAASAPASATAVANLDSWPADTRLNYRLGGHFRSGELHGSARVQWQREGDRYQTRVDIDLTLLASLVLTSQGEVTPDGLVPRAYEELRRGGPRTARMGDSSITLSDGRIVPRPAGVQDTASQFVELSHRFSSGQDPLEVGRSVSFWMARPGGLDLWTYDIVGEDVLQMPELGAVRAFHLIPRPIVNPRGNITAEIWFAPSLQYLPVRIRVSLNETTFVDLLVENIQQR
jgi:hypothetical protein